MSSLRRLTGVSLAAVVKADAYGHGALESARAALAAGAEWLAVALVEEGCELRDAGIDAPILLLAEPPPEFAGEILNARLTPTVYTFDLCSRLAEKVANAGLETPWPVHVKVDTGMHRLGAAGDVASRIVEFIESSKYLFLQGIWTHLASADELDNPFTEIQLREFNSFYERIGAPELLRHAANSAAAINYPSSRYSMIRAGIAIYGVPPSPEILHSPDLELLPVLSWKTRVSYVRELHKGDQVGYGLTYTLGRGARIATLPVGYADGYFRNLGNRAEVLIGGRRHRVVGAVSMDHITVDVGTAEISAGDEVVLIGSQENEAIPATELAALAGTIAYEILARIGKRVPRVYL